MVCAPIILFCYKRLNTLKLCVESLKKCPESKYSELIVFSDFAKDSSDIAKVFEVRNYLEGIIGFKSVKLYFREYNFGIEQNFIQALNQVTLSHEKFIVIEEDIVVSIQFLNFMNKALTFYFSNNKIFSISAINFVVIPLKYRWDCYFTGRFNPWGWASWSNRFNNLDWFITDRAIFLKNKKMQHLFNFWGSDRSRMLKKTLNQELITWDIRIDYHLFTQNLFTLYPTKNLVCNIGFNSIDASNTTGYNRFKTVINYFTSVNYRFPLFITYNHQITRRFIFINSLFNRIKTSFFKFIRFSN